MKAVYLEKHGGNDVLRMGERPDPEPGPGEVRIRVAAASLNHLDLFVRDGMPGVPIPLPQIPGADAAGTVERLGPGVEGLEPGQSVLVQPGLFCGRCEFCRSGEQSLCVLFQIVGEHVAGTFAELAVVPARNVFPVPEALSIEEAAAFPLTFETAWRMVIGRARVRPGETVLIHGIGGGAAQAALKIAVMAGARVFVTSGDDGKLSRALAEGAERGINYRTGDVFREVRSSTAKRGVDVVVDSIGEATWLTSLQCVARGGRIVTCGATTGPNPRTEIRQIFWKQISILGSTMANDREFREMLAAVSAGKIRPTVDRVVPFEEFRTAYERLESGAQYGKIVLKW
jgi:NADPH:quinone reductase-like Zn-dependent oxidoreductase